ncbi:MAG: M1 family aminopeptidase [Acidobacteriota bacterium]
MRPRRGGGVVALLGFALLGLVSSCTGPAPKEPDAGVSLELARERAGRITDLIYSLTFRVPEPPDQSLSGSLVLSFGLSGAGKPLIIDFRAPSADLETVTSGGRPVAHEFRRGQIVLPAQVLKEGRNTFEFGFKASDVALNRRRDYLYTLFVPDRAATAFPCFDQPDLKARYRLVLSLPQGWTAVSNGRSSAAVEVGRHHVVRFQETEPLSTYQFAFAAGKFQVVERKIGERTVRLYHRETDQAKLARNLDAIFDLHAQALDWLERYTAIPLPYQKFDFVLLPAFQFGGMEHPGAVYYRDTLLLLEPSATRNDELRRASLIAHETSHMWFGNLVTMRWFSDVWMKEVFANFMAAKIVNPAFPEVDHELRFLLAHQPVAYDVDRSLGTHAIRQKLENLQQAASLYGPIIYQKAPAVMRQLEVLVGEKELREGLRRYLDRFRFGNADWNDLIGILDDLTPEDLRTWSRAWVEEAGRPTVTVEAAGTGTSGAPALEIRQSDPLGRGLLWSQELHVVSGDPDSVHRQTLRLKEAVTPLDLSARKRPAFIVPSADGLGYGFFRLDEGSRRLLLAGIPPTLPAATRAAVWLSLWDGVLAGDIPSETFIEAVLRGLDAEGDELLQEHLLERVATAFWALGLWHEPDLGPRIEASLWKRLDSDAGPASKLASLRTLASVVTSDDGVERLTRLWKGEERVEGLELGESDSTRLALELALRRDGVSCEQVLDAQFQRLENPERRDEFAFERAALSSSPDRREALFEEIAGKLGTVRENWSLDALHYLTHPLRGSEAEPRIRRALELLPRVESDGSIFFPQRWLEALFWGQSSPESAKLVKDYLGSSPDLPLRLQRRVLQAADLLLRTTGAIGELKRPPDDPPSVPMRSRDPNPETPKPRNLG